MWVFGLMSVGIVGVVVWYVMKWWFYFGWKYYYCVFGYLKEIVQGFMGMLMEQCLCLMEVINFSGFVGV